MHIRGWESTSASVVLNNIHNTLYARYATQAYSKDRINNIQNAQYLQDFLSAWKEYANTGDSSNNIFSAALLSKVAEYLPKNLNFKFRTAGGVKFEKQMSAFILSLLNNPALGTNIEGKFKDNMSKILTGSKHVKSTESGSYNLSDLDDVAYALLKQSYDVIDNNLRNLALEGYRKLDHQRARVDGKEITVQGKTDFSAKQIEFTIDISAPNEIKKVINLLAKAQFTAKNYGSGEWAVRNALKKGLDPSSLHFGNSNVWRALVATLTELGYDMSVIKSIYYSAYAGADETAQLHIYHIRFIYELTGLGQKQVDNSLKEFGEAEFLIYNDYNSNEIYVRSTADLILEMFQEIFDGDWQKAIRITKNVVAKKS